MNLTCIKPRILNRGFTLVELIVVILLIGILSISIAPRFFSVTSYQDRKASDELLSALRYTQQMAMARGGNIQLNLQNNNFTIEISGSGTDLRSPDGAPYPRFFDGVTTTTPGIYVFDGLGRRVPNTEIDITIGNKTIRIEQDTGYAHQL